MLSLSQTTGYAILAMSCLDDPDGSPSSVPNVAMCTRIPKTYLSKVFQILAAKGFVKTKRGSKGGILLSRPSEDITLWEIAEAMEGPGWIGNCLLGIPQCQGDCPTHEFWDEERGRIEEKLRSITIKEMADFRGCRLHPRRADIAPARETAEGASSDEEAPPEEAPEKVPAGVGWCSGEDLSREKY